MRILRGKSNLEVSSQGFAWFVVGLVLASFIGGAVRTILSSNVVHTRIVSELRNRFPKQKFEIGQTQVLLSNGIWPGLGLKVRNVVFEQEVCGKLSFKLEVPEAVLPVNVFSLRKGRLKLGHVELKDGRIHFNYKPCPPDPVTIAEDESTGKSKKPMISAASLDWRKASEHLNAIDLTNFTVTYERNDTWKVIVRSMALDLTGDLAARGLLDVQKSLPFGSLSHIVDLEAQGDDKVLQWGIHSEFKEGLVNIKGSYDYGNSAAMVQVFARQLPLKDVMSELFQMGFVEKDVVLKTTWLSCGLHWEGAIARPEQTPIVAKDCKIEGGYGRVDLDNAEFFTDWERPLKAPAKMRVSKLQIAPLLEALGRQVLPTVLSRPGVWSGTFAFMSAKEWKLEGYLENLEIAFSHRSVRGKQIIEKLRTFVQKLSGRVEATVDEVSIRDGEFQGQVKFDLHEDWRDGQFRADVEKLRLSQSIQTLLVGGKLGILQFKGEGALASGELAKWQGQFELDEIAGAGWDARKISVKSNFVPPVFHLDGRIAMIGVNSNWASFAQVREVYPNAGNEVHWRDLAGKFGIHANGGTINSVMATLDASPSTVWKAKGSWVREGELNAAVTIGKAKPISLIGEKGLLNVQR